MAYGPAELIVVRFPGNQFKGEIAPALGDLIEAEELLVEQIASRSIDYLTWPDLDLSIFPFEQRKFEEFPMVFFQQISGEVVDVEPAADGAAQRAHRPPP